MEADAGRSGSALWGASDEEIGRVLACASFSLEEMAAVAQVLRAWNAEGRMFRLWREEWSGLPQPQGDDFAALMASVGSSGILPFRAYDLRADFRLCKVGLGRGWFGGRKVRLHWYVSADEGAFIPSSSASGLISAFAQVGSIYRAHGL